MLKNKLATYLGTAAMAFALGALVASSPALAGGDDVVRLRSQLTGTGDISGQADFRNRGRLQWSVEVEGLTAGDMLAVMVDGENVGTITIDGLGMGEQGFDTNFEAGDDPATVFPGNFPALTGGEAVSVGPLSGNLQPK